VNPFLMLRHAQTSRAQDTDPTGDKRQRNAKMQWNDVLALVVGATVGLWGGALAAFLLCRHAWLVWR
jgi:hypothetical protein